MQSTIPTVTAQCFAPGLTLRHRILPSKKPLHDTPDTLMQDRPPTSCRQAGEEKKTKDRDPAVDSFVPHHVVRRSQIGRPRRLRRNYPKLVSCAGPTRASLRFRFGPSIVTKGASGVPCTRRRGVAPKQTSTSARTQVRVRYPQAGALVTKVRDNILLSQWRQSFFVRFPGFDERENERASGSVWSGWLWFRKPPAEGYGQMDTRLHTRTCR